MYKQMLCPRPIPRILFDKLTVWGYSILSSQRPTSFIGKKSENPQWSMIETWEFDYVDGISLKIIWNFHCMIAIMVPVRFSKKHIKASMNLCVLCMVFNQVLSKLDMQPWQVSPVCPLSKVTWLGNCSSCNFLKDGNSSREHDSWKEKPNKTEDRFSIHDSICFRLVFMRMEISQTQRP